jgi:hypothetical protein
MLLGDPQSSPLEVKLMDEGPMPRDLAKGCLEVACDNRIN